MFEVGHRVKELSSNMWGNVVWIYDGFILIDFDDEGDLRRVSEEDFHNLRRI